MSPEQLFECRKHIYYSEKLLIEQFNHNSTFERIKKTSFGITIYMACSKLETEKCKTFWIISLNVDDHEVIVSCNKKCSHSISSEARNS